MLERRSRVLVVDDDLEMCGMLREYLSKEQFDVALAHDGDAALQAIAAQRPDIVLLDVSMPGPGVLEVIKTLKRIRPKLGILVLSVHPERHYAKRVLMAGADGYLTKNESSAALAPAIRYVCSGRKFLTPSLAQELASDLTRKRSGQLHEMLSDREYQVFVQLGGGKGIDEIATQLKLSPKTVRTYRSRILEKTNLKSTAEIIFYAIDHGLVTHVGDGSMPHSDHPTVDRSD